MSKSPSPPSPASPGGRPRTGLAVRSQAKPKLLPGLPETEAVALTRHTENLTEALQHELTRNRMGYAISLGLHVAFLVVCAVVIVASTRLSEPADILARWTSDIEAARRRDAKNPIALDNTIRLDNTPVENQPKTPPKPEVNPLADVKIVNPSKVDVKDSLKNRNAKKEAKVDKTGGNDKTEKAVTNGLAWFTKQQQTDGRWRMHDGYPDPGDNSLRTDTGATALAALCYLGAGFDHRNRNPYREHVSKAITWLVQRQKPDGDFHDRQELGLQTSFYAHAQATIAVLEAYAMTGDESLKTPATKAIQFICKSQHPLTGGWKYRPGSEGDLSVFGWQIMALQTARMAGLEVPEETLIQATVFLDQVQEQNGARYKYEPAYPSQRFTPAMTAEGLLCRQYLGWPRNHPSLQAGAKYLVIPENLPEWAPGKRNVYFWYYATQTLHNMQGAEWNAWNTKLRESITKGQVVLGKNAGSWNPRFERDEKGHHDEHGDAGGRLYVSAFCILTLESYYRHLPLYRDPNDTAEPTTTAAAND